jgi:hypothetical protein
MIKNAAIPKTISIPLKTKNRCFRNEGFSSFGIDSFSLDLVVDCFTNDTDG